MPIDYSKYPQSWKTEIVPRILERSFNRCECCGVENGSIVWSLPLMLKDGSRYKTKRIWTGGECSAKRLQIQLSIPERKIKKVRVVLTVAHLDHDEENHDVKDDRLAAMCQSCHLNYDAKEKYRRAISK